MKHNILLYRSFSSTCAFFSSLDWLWVYRLLVRACADLLNTSKSHNNRDEYWIILGWEVGKTQLNQCFYSILCFQRNRAEQTVPTIEHTVYRVHCHQFKAIPSVWRASFFMSFIHFNSIATDTAADENGQEQKLKQTDARRRRTFHRQFIPDFFPKK